LARRLNPEWDDLDSQEQDSVINEIFDSFTANEPVSVVSGTNNDFGFGKDRVTSVKPKAGALKPTGNSSPTPAQTPTRRVPGPTNAPSVIPNTLPPEIVQQMKVNVITTLNDGSKWIKNRDGSVTKVTR
jgi:hypothetical protein